MFVDEVGRNISGRSAIHAHGRWGGHHFVAHRRNSTDWPHRRQHHAWPLDHCRGDHACSDSDQEIAGERVLVGRPSVILARSLSLLLNLVFGLPGFPFGLLKFLQGLAVDAYIKGDDVFLVVLENFAAVARVVHKEVSALLLVFEVDSADEGVVVSDWEDVDLQNVRVDLPEAFDQLFLELLISLFRVILVESLSYQRQIGVVLLNVEKKFHPEVCPCFFC